MYIIYITYNTNPISSSLSATATYIRLTLAFFFFFSTSLLWKIGGGDRAVFFFHFKLLYISSQGGALGPVVYVYKLPFFQALLRG